MCFCDDREKDLEHICGNSNGIIRPELPINDVGELDVSTINKIAGLMFLTSLYRACKSEEVKDVCKT